MRPMIACLRSLETCDAQQGAQNDCKQHHSCRPSLLGCCSDRCREKGRDDGTPLAGARQQGMQGWCRTSMLDRSSTSLTSGGHSLPVTEEEKSAAHADLSGLVASSGSTCSACSSCSPLPAACAEEEVCGGSAAASPSCRSAAPTPGSRATAGESQRPSGASRCETSSGAAATANSSAASRTIPPRAKSTCPEATATSRPACCAPGCAAALHSTRAVGIANERG